LRKRSVRRERKSGAINVTRISPRMIKMEILVALCLTKLVVIAMVGEINVDLDLGKIYLF
jgi:hypothetical protein